MITTPVALAGIAAALLLLLQHYAILPYVRHIWRRNMPIILRYVAGMLAVNGSLVMLFWLEPSVEPATAVIWVTSCGGTAVMLAYVLDKVVEELAQRREERELKDI